MPIGEGYNTTKSLSLKNAKMTKIASLFRCLFWVNRRFLENEKRYRKMKRSPRGIIKLGYVWNVTGLLTLRSRQEGALCVS